MCDTFVHVSSTGSVIFGKNSDREPNEAQQILHVPAHRRRSGKVQATYIDVDLPEEVHEVFLSKPFQMWGAEIGVNVHGVAIGNEAVFTKGRKRRKNSGLTGMDLLRIALESSTSAEEALHRIIEFLERHGQQADGGYRQTFYYDNSFIVADARTAFVLETAGRFWVWKRIRGYRAISNGLSIGEDYDAAHPEAEAFSVQKGYHRSGRPFDFRAAFASRWMPRLASSDQRRACSTVLASTFSVFDAASAFQVLRTHGKEPFHPSKGGTGSICMHASGRLCPSQTTGSMVVELSDRREPLVWWTGSSAPCLSLFKPFFFGTRALNTPEFPEPTDRVNDAYWWRWEAFHRHALLCYRKIRPEFTAIRQHLEPRWQKRAAELFGETEQKKSNLIRESVDVSLKVMEDLMGKMESETRPGRYFYQRYWMRQNKRV